MRSTPSILLLFLAFIASVQIGCDRNGQDTCANDFDQPSLLNNVGNNIILPRYSALVDACQEMDAAIQAFANNPSASTLTEARTKWLIANKAWQRASIFEFGPAETHDLRGSLGKFPVFKTKVDESISTGTYDLDDVNYAFARGFTALDYLLYGVADEADIPAFYTNTDAQGFLNAVSQHILQKVTLVNDEWKADNGNYIGTFLSSEGVASGSAASNLINQFNADYELFKNDKIGTPVGAKTSYIPAPSTVESFYGRHSLELAIEAAKASKDLFLGVNEVTGSEGVGLDDYIAATGAQQGETPLETVIKNQYNEVLSSLEGLQPSTLYDAINNDFEAVKVAYAMAQNQVVYIKTDMPSVLCVSITYVDNTDDSD